MSTSDHARALDQAKAEAFGHRVFSLLNDSYLCLAIALGHQTRLFDTMAGLAPSTSQEIARAAGLSERYVREWLATLVCGGVVDYDGKARTYHLPPEHAVSLTRAAGPNNVAFFCQYPATSAVVVGAIAERFETGAGLPASESKAFFALAREESRLTFDAALVDGILPLATGVVERLRGGIDVLDVGCGSGHAIALMARAFPKSRFVGYDIDELAIQAGRDELAALGVTNARLEVRDALTMTDAENFDLITAFDAIHPQSDPLRVLERCRRALRPGGRLLCSEIGASPNLADNAGHAFGPVLYATSMFHCVSASLARGGSCLGCMWGDAQARGALLEAGFDDVTQHRRPGDPLHVFLVAHRA